MNHPEHNEQVALFKWASLQTVAYPELQWLFAVPNSARRSPRQGAWMKAEGLKSGVWDIFLPAVRRNNDNPISRSTAGLFIEMKVGKNKLTPEQIAFRNDLEGDYKFVVCYNWIEAKIAIMDYLAR